MKLILTSNGITNNSIEQLVKEQFPYKKKIAFIPTAANIISGDRSGVEKHYSPFPKIGQTTIVDISKGNKREWLHTLQESNIIVMGGGNAKYLMEQIIISGILLDLPKLLEDKVYIGISAGSMIASKKVYSSNECLFSDKDLNIKPHDGLGLVDFNIKPHFNSIKLLEDYSLRNAMSRVHSDMYALDDNSVIFYDNGKISVVSQGEWKIYKNN